MTRSTCDHDGVSPVYENGTSNARFSLGLNDSAGGSANYSDSIAEAWAFLDSVSYASPAGSVTETYSLADTVSALVNHPVSISESYSLADTIGAVKSVNVSIAEVLTFADSVNGVRGVVGNIAETIHLADGVNGTVTLYPLTTYFDRLGNKVTVRRMNPVPRE